MIFLLELEISGVAVQNIHENSKNGGQVDSTELPERPEITEMTENFTKFTKYLTKFKEILINYVWEKSHIKKQ